MKKPKTYKTWTKQTGQEIEFGSKAIVADKLLKKLGIANLYQILVPLLAEQIAKGLVQNGARIPLFEISIESDELLRAKEYVASLEAIQGALPIEYLSMAYHAWQQNYEEITCWEEKSLADYLECWWLRECLHRKDKGQLLDRVALLLDELNPGWHD